MLECLNVCGKVRSRQKSALSSAGRSDEVLCGIPCWNFILLLVGVCTSAGWVGSDRRLRGHCWKNILRPLRPRVNPASPCSSLTVSPKPKWESAVLTGEVGSGSRMGRKRSIFRENFAGYCFLRKRLLVWKNSMGFRPDQSSQHQSLGLVLWIQAGFTTVTTLLPPPLSGARFCGRVYKGSSLRNPWQISSF